MGSGRGKSTVACLAAIIVALLLGACGAKEHANEPRPASPSQLNVSINAKKVSVSPTVVGVVGPALRAQALDQGVEQNTPLLVAVTVANQTNFDTHVEIRGRKESTSPIVVAGGTATYKVYLPTGEYLIGAGDIPGAIAARLSVGPDRTSSDNDLLLP